MRPNNLEIVGEQPFNFLASIAVGRAAFHPDTVAMRHHEVGSCDCDFFVHVGSTVAGVDGGTIAQAVEAANLSGGSPSSGAAA